MIVSTMIPDRRNDGTLVTIKEQEAIHYLIRSTFGGFTATPCWGQWKDNGKVYDEGNTRIDVICRADQVGSAKNLFVAIGRRLGQLAIYWECRDGGEILSLEHPERELAK
jgi:hypothetical protein